MEKQLTLTQRIALKACQEAILLAQNQFNAVLTDCGLDPKKNYQMSETGLVEEVAKPEIVK